MINKNMVLSIFIIPLVFSCSKVNYPEYDSEKFNEKQMEVDENGIYIVYKYKLPKGYWKYYPGKYNVFYLLSDYGLRMDADLNGNLDNIYLYNGITGIKYKMKNLNELENIINNNFPPEIIIYYYQFCSSGSGVKNDRDILYDIKNILLNKNIKFAFSEYNEYDENYDSELVLKWMDTCLGF